MKLAAGQLLLVASAASAYVVSSPVRLSVASRIGCPVLAEVRNVGIGISKEVIDECLVDAENAAEQAACYSEPVANPEPLSYTNPPPVSFAVDAECVVDAENVEELMACGDVTLGTTYQELSLIHI